MPNKFVPVILASFVMVAISLFPLLNLINLLCCSGIIFGGFAGTAFYSRQLAKAGMVIQFKDGAAIGILSGIISAMLVVIFSTVLSMLLKQNPIPELFKLLDTQGFHLPAEMETFMRTISDEYNRSGFSITLTLISAGMNIITYPLFGAIGGLIGASIFIRRNVQQ